ncbi:MAG: SDR family NAD(P)-dependent oxidoreductase [Gammaproteobacteria bacterium]|nr:SDR family NAD(P)-dependent oxidoreductase [Gammaproteobacteria bacterium]
MSDFAKRYGPWAVVAGASEGLGASFAACLARRGVHLVLLARRLPLLHELADALRGDHGVEVRCVALDLGDADWPDALREATADVELGLLVYNAAMVPVGRFVDTEADALERSVRVNALAPVRFLRAFLPSLCARGRGGVVLMSSLSGLQGTPRVATYAATKAFNAILAEGLWHELRSDGVDVVACSAGAVPTPGYLRSTDRRAPGMLPPDVVADRTLDALGHGPGMVPGALNRFMAQVIRRVLPRRTAIRLMAANTRHLVDPRRP